MRERRRLITLISAGRNRIVMIRRELPRTKDTAVCLTLMTTATVSGTHTKFSFSPLGAETNEDK